MSEPGFARQAVALFHDRWQVPAALVAVLAASVALYRLMPKTPAYDLGTVLADVTALEEAGRINDAADAIGNLLEMDPPLPPAQRAVLHRYLADLIYRRERDKTTHNLNNLRLLLQQEEAAQELGRPADAAAKLRVAQASEWLGDELNATKSYREVLELEPTPEQRRLARQGLVRLLEDKPEARTERERLLEQLLDDEGVSTAYVWWALQEALKQALDEHDTIRARLLLGKYADRLKTSDLSGYNKYLWAWVMVHEGRTEEAEPLVRWIDEWLEQRPGLDEALESHGHLPALNRWLLGMIHLTEYRPQQALLTFEEALDLMPPGRLFVAAVAGQGQALAALGRHDEALACFREALERLEQLPEQRRRGEAALRRTLLALYDQLSAREAYAEALPYLSLANELIPPELTDQRADVLEKLGRAALAAAERAADPREQTAELIRAGEYLSQAAELCLQDETRYASLLWDAAQAYDRAGRIADARRVLLEFLEGRSEDPRLPRAYLQVGQAFEADGDCEGALEWYRRVFTEYPRLEESFRAQLLRAGCLRFLGRVAEAEAALLNLLEDDHIAPEAVIYHDALLELCDLLYQQGRYAEAISRLEDFASLYPDDPERCRSRFLLADAYRRSAYALRDNPPAGANPQRAAEVSAERFARAAELFAELSRLLAEEPCPTGGGELYARLALFYQADCLFELNEPNTLDEALGLYRQAAARYELEPAALTALVQMANIYLRRGQIPQAAQAVERARWLLRNIPDSAFDAYPGGSDRAAWARYLDTVASAEIFRGVFAGNP